MATKTMTREEVDSSRSRVATKVIRKPSYEVLFREKDEGDYNGISYLWKQFDVIEVTSDTGEDQSILVGFNTGRIVKWSYKQQQIERVIDLPPSPQQQQQFQLELQQRKQGITPKPRMISCIAKHSRVIKLVDEKRYVTLSDDSLVLYTLNEKNYNSSQEEPLKKQVIHTGFTRCSAFSLWRLEPEEEGPPLVLVATLEASKHLQVWKLGGDDSKCEEPFNPVVSLRGVEAIFDDGLYAHGLSADERLFAIGNILRRRELGHTRTSTSTTSTSTTTTRTGGDPQLVTAVPSNLIGLHNGGFVTSDHRKVHLWSKTGTYLKTIEGTSIGDLYCTLHKMRSRRGFFVGGLYEGAICGLTEDGDFLFIYKVSVGVPNHNDFRLRCVLSGGSIVVGDVHRLQLWDTSMYVVVVLDIFDILSCWLYNSFLTTLYCHTQWNGC